MKRLLVFLIVVVAVVVFPKELIAAERWDCCSSTEFCKSVCPNCSSAVCDSFPSPPACSDTKKVCHFTYNTDACKDTCNGNWGPWSACYTDPSNGKKVQTRWCLRNGQKACNIYQISLCGQHEPPPPPTITSFKITNFRLQETTSGIKYYQVLKEQMAVNHPNYQLNLRWSVEGADTCVAKCKYVSIDDYLNNQNIDQLTPLPYPCDENINGKKTFSGEVQKPIGTAKVKPRENGIIRYTLKCSNRGGSDRKDILVVIQELRWFESIPILNQQGSAGLRASLFNLMSMIKSFVPRLR